jgi:hypothetical protein
MPAAIYFYSRLPLREARGGLEDDLEEALLGVVEVTGGGGGQSGWNIDLEVCDEVSVEEASENLSAFLQNWGVPKDTYLKVYADDWAEGQEPQELEVFFRRVTLGHAKCHLTGFRVLKGAVDEFLR